MKKNKEWGVGKSKTGRKSGLIEIDRGGRIGNDKEREEKERGSL